jgi:hypothetical protein
MMPWKTSKLPSPSFFGNAITVLQRGIFAEAARYLSAFLVAKRATPNRRVGSQGKARGEYASVLLGRYKYANQTIACQSKVFWRNNTANKTALARRSERDDMIHNFTGGSLGSGIPAKINSATAENRR